MSSSTRRTSGLRRSIRATTLIGTAMLVVVSVLSVGASQASAFGGGDGNSEGSIEEIVVTAPRIGPVNIPVFFDAPNVNFNFDIQTPQIDLGSIDIQPPTREEPVPAKTDLVRCIEEQEALGVSRYLAGNACATYSGGVGATVAFCNRSQALDLGTLLGSEAARQRGYPRVARGLWQIELGVIAIHIAICELGGGNDFP